MMNYPKLGEKYKLASDLLFNTTRDSVVGVESGATITFKCIPDKSTCRKDTLNGEFADSVLCCMSWIVHDNTEIELCIPYRLLVELVQSGALIKTEDSMTDKLTKILDTKVQDLGLSVRALNVLYCGNISTVRDLVSMTESDLLKHRMCGVKMLREVKAKLTQLGVAFLPPR